MKVHLFFHLKMHLVSGSMPACRAPLSCATKTFPKPDIASGLGMPQALIPLKETEYIDYQCLEGASWQLFGDYTPEEFSAEGASIVTGKLRVQCLLGGTMATVTKWPPCRDTAVKKCNVNGTSPLLPASTGLRKVSL